MITLLAGILIAALILGLFYWLFTKVEILQPFAQIVLVVVVVIFVIILIVLLLPLTGAQLQHSWLLR